MGILQDPISAIAQVERYLEEKNMHDLLEAHEIAAGNLCRQILEQVLFILCFYSRMPPQWFLRADRTLKTPRRLLELLNKVDTATHKTYWQLARQRSPRIAKFVRKPATLRKWSKLLNEPSHFSLKNRTVSSAKLYQYVSYMKPIFDERDWHLITIAINEIFSNGRFTAEISDAPDYVPGLYVRCVVSPKNLKREADGRLALEGPKRVMKMIRRDEIPRGPWPRSPVFVVGTYGFSIGFKLVNRNGNPIDLSSIRTIIDTMAESVQQKRYLASRLRKLGIPARVKPVERD